MHFDIITFITELKQLQNLECQITKQLGLVFGINLVFVLCNKNFIQLLNDESLIRPTLFIIGPEFVQEIRLLFELVMSILDVLLDLG